MALTLTCPTCTKKFQIKPSRLKDGYKKYCSRACAHASTRLGKTVSCHGCGKKVYKSRKALNGSKSSTFFCTKSCQTKWRNTTYVREKHANWKGGTHTYRQMLIESGTPQVCGHCGATDLRILAAHHLDEDRSNNTVENLAWLCHNCHHLIHHYPDERKLYLATMV
jgi:hypothetical protein